jgi:hypothetical protein
MSQSDIKEVLDRTMQEEESLDQFRADPDAILGEYDLTETEEEMFKEGELFDVMDDGPVAEGAAVCICVVVVVISG